MAPSPTTATPTPTPSNLPTAPSGATIVGGFAPVPGCAAQVPATLPPNGRLAAAELCPIGGGHELRADAAATFLAMDAAYRLTFGSDLCVSDSYRSYASQVSLYARKPSLAAVPGTSNHGWGIAVDMFCGVGSYSSPQYDWLTAHGPAYGWTNPEWARQGGGRAEPWHWEFDRSLVE